MNNPLHQPGAAESAASVAAFPTSLIPTPGVQETPANLEPTALALSQNAAAPTPVMATRVQLPQLPYGNGLLPRQRIALQALAGGQGPRAAAQLAGVSEMTLYRWRRLHPRFIAAWNMWEAESAKTARDCLVVAREHAARTVMQAAQSGDVRVSLAVLKGLEALAPLRTGPCFAGEVKLQVADANDEIRRKNKGRTRAHREFFANKRREQKEAAERRKEWFDDYLTTPPLPRPITPEAIRESVLALAGRFRMRDDACSVRITAITGDRKPLAEMCVKYCKESCGPIEGRLESLPLLLDHFANAACAEEAACLFESHGATVEFRPGWVELK